MDQNKINAPFMGIEFARHSPGGRGASQLSYGQVDQKIDNGRIHTALSHTVCLPSAKLFFLLFSFLMPDLAFY